MTVSVVVARRPTRIGAKRRPGGVNSADEAIQSRLAARFKSARRLSNFLEQNVLRALPQRQLAERGEILAAFHDGEKMVAGELADLAGEADAPVGQQDLGLADAAGVEDDVARR